VSNFIVYAHLVDAQVATWMAELRSDSSRLAGQIAAATGKQYAVVLMSGTDADYADVIPELILEDALRVVTHRLAGRHRM
jgi:hypothetical protein